VKERWQGKKKGKNGSEVTNELSGTVEKKGERGGLGLTERLPHAEAIWDFEGKKREITGEKRKGGREEDSKIPFIFEPGLQRGRGDTERTGWH